MKLSKIKEELAKLLIQMSVLKTDKAVLEYEGDELTAGMNVYITNEDDERVAPEDGDYATEDGKVITVKDGRVDTIVEKEDEIEADDAADVDVVAEEVVEEETVEEPKEEAVEEEVKAEEPETRDEEIAKLREEINELYKLVDSILEKIGETRKEADERFTKLEQMSAAKPASEEFEAVKEVKKSKNKYDKLFNTLNELKK